MYVFQLSFEKQKSLMEILDGNDGWRDLAAEIKISLDLVNKLQAHADKGQSPTQEVLLAYGARGHTVEQLFRVLAKYKHFRALGVLLDVAPDNCKAIYERLKPSMTRSTIPNDHRSVPDHQSHSRSPLGDQDHDGSGYGSAQQSNHHGTGAPQSSHQGSKICSKHGTPIPSSSSNPQLRKQSRPEQNSSGSTHDTAKAAGLHNTLTVPYEELKDATDSFSQNKIIGKGGYGVVYKASWKHMDVAVKRIISKSRSRSPEEAATQIDDEQLRQSLKELRALALFRHDNILPLYGYSLDGPEPCLIYQFMGQGSLEDRLQCRVGVFLCSTPASKPYTATKSGQVAVPSGAPPLIASHIRGTLAYLPPEFIHKKHLSYHLDIFSFGVVLYEAATGLKAYSEQRKPHSKLVDYMTKCLEETSKFRKVNIENMAKLSLENEDEKKRETEKYAGLFELADERAGALDQSLFLKFLKLGQLSTKKDPQERLTTADILDNLV